MIIIKTLGVTATTDSIAGEVSDSTGVITSTLTASRDVIASTVNGNISIFFLCEVTASISLIASIKIANSGVIAA